jgi:hypothetical protein
MAGDRARVASPLGPRDIVERHQHQQPHRPPLALLAISAAPEPSDTVVDASQDEFQDRAQPTT